MLSTQPGFLELVWRDEYACGYPTIDAQHRHMFATGNALLDAILMDRPKRTIEPLLGEFVDEAKNHFLAEESILDAGDREEAAAHKKLHQKLIETANTLCARYSEGKVHGGAITSFLVYDLVEGHIAKEDKRWLAEAARRVSNKIAAASSTR